MTELSKNKLIQAVSGAYVRSGKVLLVRRGRAPAKGLYAFPGGRIEPGETMEDALVREFREETGLEAISYAPLRTVELGRTEPGPAVYALTVFLVRKAGGTLAAGDDAAEAGWFTLAEAETLPITASTRLVVRELLGRTD